MDGPQTGTENSAVNSKTDNLDVVLGRFQNWARTQRIRPVSPTPAGAKLAPGAREISYEQALRASSYRRTVNTPTDSAYLGPVPPEIKPNPAVRASNQVAPPPTPDAPKNPAAQPRIGTAAAKSSEILEPRRAEARFTAAAQALVQSATAPETTTVTTPTPILASPATRKKSPNASPPKVKSTRTATGKPSETPPVKKSRKSAPQAKAACPVDGAVFTTAADKVDKIDTSPRLSPEPKAEAGFSDALQHAIALTTAKSTGAPATPNITVERGSVNTLTLKISDREKSRLETNAADLNLSLNDYLMQCALRAEPQPGPHRTEQTDLSESVFLRQYALGVDELRDQMKLALARLNHRQTQNTLPTLPGLKLSMLPGILARFAVQSLRRLRKPAAELPAVFPR